MWKPELPHSVLAFGSASAREGGGLPAPQTALIRTRISIHNYRDQDPDTHLDKPSGEIVLSVLDSPTQDPALQLVRGAVEPPAAGMKPIQKTITPGGEWHHIHRHQGWACIVVNLLIIKKSKKTT